MGTQDFTETAKRESYRQAQREFNQRGEEFIWKAAKHALEAKRDGLNGWKEIAAEEAKRSVRTIEERVAGAELAEYLKPYIPRTFALESLPLSFYTRAARYTDRLSVAALANAVQDAIKNRENVDMFTEKLANAAKGDTPPVFDVCDVLSELLNRTIKARNKAEVTEDATDLGEVATLLDHKLQRAMRRSASVLDPSGKDDTSDVSES